MYILVIVIALVRDGGGAAVEIEALCVWVFESLP